MIFEIVFYTEYSDGSELNYKIYNLRGDVVLTLSEDNTIKSKDRYFAFGEHISRGGDIKTDMHRANTKVEDSGNLLNEGKRFRQLEYGIFLTPDPLEYVDGYNPYIYCGQNPWGKWDPLGLAELIPENPTYRGERVAFPEGKIEFWSRSVGSSKLEFNKDKKYFTAQRVNITIKDNSDSNKSEKNSYHDINFIVLREVLVDPSSSKMIPQSMKELLQDEFNDANITFESRLEVELTTDFRIYEGNIPVNKNIKESNVVCADTEYQGNERWPKNESKNFIV